MTPPTWTAEKAEALKRLCEAATPGPWYQAEKNPEQVLGEHGFITAVACSTPSIDGRSMRQRASDQAAFIAAARTALPDALAEIERLTETERLNDIAMADYRHTLVAKDAALATVTRERETAQAQTARLTGELDTIRQNLRELHRQATIDREANLTCNCIRWMDLLGLTPEPPREKA